MSMARESDVCDQIAAAELSECGPIIRPLLELIRSDPKSFISRWYVRRDGSRLKVKAIARALGISPQAVEDLIEHARRVLREEVQATSCKCKLKIRDPNLH